MPRDSREASATLNALPRPARVPFKDPESAAAVRAGDSERSLLVFAAQYPS